LTLTPVFRIITGTHPNPNQEPPMNDLSANLPQIISAAAQSPLGILALLSLALSVLAYFFFAQASEKVKVGIFGMLFVGVVGFGAAMFGSQSAEAVADGRDGAGGAAGAPPEVATDAGKGQTAQLDTEGLPPSSAGEPMMGDWSGQAKDAHGDTFQVAVHIDKPCTPDQPCGTIHVSSGPCTGELTLASQQGPDREFSVDHFSKDSADQCSAGAGEHFRLQADGTLRYTTDYEPKAHATLTKNP
jgi:hypothetical protein